MPDRTFRFIHASDLWLDIPARGLADIPESLGDVLIDAPMKTAEKIFQTACTEHVDMVILSGNILNPRLSDLRAHLFLVEQFRHLATQGIAVYWAGGRYDTPEAWPEVFELPENVTFFPSDRVETVVHRRDESTEVAAIRGFSRGDNPRIPIGGFHGDEDGLFTIAVLNYTGNPDIFQSRNIDYCALGGTAVRRTLPGVRPVINWPGSPMGRSPAEKGAFGFSLVDVEGSRSHTTFVPTGRLRWITERVTIDRSTSRDDLLLQLMERAESLRQMGGAAELLVSWVIDGSGPLLNELSSASRDGDEAQARLLQELQEGTGSGGAPNSVKSNGGVKTSRVWNVAMSVHPADMLPQVFYQQKNLLNDYLQTISNYQMNPEEPIDLNAFMSKSQREGKIGRIAQLGSASERESVLREAAILGVDLLSSEGSQR
mgnify:CR=1 FL=1